MKVIEEVVDRVLSLLPPGIAIMLLMWVATTFYLIKTCFVEVNKLIIDRKGKKL